MEKERGVVFSVYCFEAQFHTFTCTEQMVVMPVTPNLTQHQFLFMEGKYKEYVRLLHEGSSVSVEQPRPWPGILMT